MSRSLAFHAFTFLAVSGACLRADDVPALFTAKEVAQGYRDHVVFAKPRADRRAELFAHDPHWKDLLLYYEYFHAETGEGLGASHQTGWTALVAKLIQQSGE